MTIGWWGGGGEWTGRLTGGRRITGEDASIPVVKEQDFEIKLEDDHARVFNAFEPLEPASVDQYLDMDAVRGNESGIIKAVLKQIRLSRDQYVRFLFTGHIGCGKSSELRHLEHILLHRPPQAGQSRFFPVFIDTFEYLSDYDADPIDLLLAVVAELAAKLREHLNIELKDSYFKDRLGELRGLLLSDVSIDEGDLELWNVKLKLKLLKANEVARAQVRETLRPRMTTILGEINSLLTRVRTLLLEKNTGYSDIVLIVDNLEKIRKVTNAAEGFASHRELFLEQYAKLTGFNAHVIYTVPLRLVRSNDAPQLVVRYPHIFIVPSVKVAERNHEPFQPGRDALRKLVELRVKPSPIPAIFNEDALEFILDYCGGHVRHLMLFARAAIAYADELPLDLTAAKQALKQMINIFANAIPEGQWDKLVALERSNNQEIVNGDADYLSLLENSAILEYLDADTSGDDLFDTSVPWYAVHPVVRRLPKFRQRMETNGDVNGNGTNE
jgi:energy-coupling factor transporter ATP-binding protein EcfA2